MLRKPIVHLLIGALLLSVIGARPIAAQSKVEITPAYTASVKKRIVKLGTGSEAKVQVKLQGKTKLKGYVSKITEDSFVVTDAKTNTETTVSYPTVTDLKTKMSTGEVIAVSALAAGAAFVVFIVLAVRYAD
jgi:hypothetical protein